MAKSTAHLDKLGAYDSFKAPWESEAGADAEVDKPVLKRLVYNLKKDLAGARDANEDAKVSLAEAESARDEAKSQAADGTGAEAQKTIDKLTKDLEKVTGERDTLKAGAELAVLRSEVLGDFAAENPKAAKYVVGTTREELEESLAAVKEDFGISDEPKDGDDDDNDDEPVVRTAVRGTRLTNPADAKNGQGSDKAVDYDKVADEALGLGLRY